MTYLPSLPTELICEILGYLEPTTKLHEYDIPEEQRWDVRHWGRTIAAVARTCHALSAIAIPLLYSRYEAAFHNPVIAFIDRSTVGTPRHQGVRHVAIRRKSDSDRKYTPTSERLSQYRTWTQDSDLVSCLLSRTQSLTPEDAGQIELWRLISQAPNIESISVIAYSWPEQIVDSHDQPPVWMFPMVSAGQTDQTNLKYSGWFQKLHTLEFDMQGQCGTWLIQLLSLPSLKSLSLRSWGIKPYDDWEASLVWPEPTATSVVHNLNLWNTSVTSDVIVRIMDYCVALRSFRCNRALDNRFGTGVRGRQWCVEILAGLQRHNQTLASLDLDPYDTHDRFYLQEEYGRVDGFQQLVALNSLNVPWHVIMGSPAGVKNAQDHWKPVEDFTYLNMRDILPKNLRHLKIHKSDHSTPDCTGIEQALNSLLPASDADTGALLNRLEFIYDNAHYYKPLPMNFWRIQSAFQAAGCAFSYKLKLDPSDFWMTDSYGLKQQVNQFADTLAKEGVAGVQTALRTGVLGLPERVMELVGLGKEWLDTEEAKEVLFGEKVDTWSKRGINF